MILVEALPNSVDHLLPLGRNALCRPRRASSRLDSQSKLQPDVLVFLNDSEHDLAA
jgi:hypothetical protein